MDESTTLVTSNVDKAALTACADRLLALRTNTVVVRGGEAVPDVSQSLLELRYSDKDYPNAFGNFRQGGCAQVLGNGNVEWGVANGTKCKFVSLAWNNVDDIDRVLQPLASISARCGSVIELSCAPDFIIVKLVTQTGDAIPATTWLTENNLENNWKSGVDGRKERGKKQHCHYNWCCVKQPKQIPHQTSTDSHSQDS
ncbi:hypothetical protein JG688_00007693 [Phytophthora aleatoria]|uniref:Uncharacterized protein n=1 Tax=Phytophthora aleatoria TaxID=2496075 RepID=A0A8J5J7Q3_9STRA|nr:hypothetical protein JG688_00007693 [Phytophthora aleatoria]